MYNGLIAQLVGITPEKAIKLAANDFYRYILPKNARGELDFHMEMVAGAMAGLSQVVATNPMEIVKIRMQINKRAASEVRFSGDFRCPNIGLMQVLRELGIAGLYKGTSSTLLRDIPFSAMYFPFYARLKKYLAEEKGFSGGVGQFMSGCGAGTRFVCLFVYLFVR